MHIFRLSECYSLLLALILSLPFRIFFLIFMIHNLLSASLPAAHELAYFIIYVVLASLVYIVMVKRVGDELPRKTVDGIFFVMVATAGLIWGLSKVPPIS